MKQKLGGLALIVNDILQAIFTHECQCCESTMTNK